MNSIEQQDIISKRNSEIEEAVAVSQMMESRGYKIVARDLKIMEETFRFQDILGIKEGALSDQKGMVIGFQETQKYFVNKDRLAKEPRRDPKTGKKEILNKKKGE